MPDRRACRRCTQVTAEGSALCTRACRNDELPHRHWHCKACGCGWIEAEVAFREGRPAIASDRTRQLIGALVGPIALALILGFGSGCAIGRVTPEGGIQGLAVGHAMIVRCLPPAELPPIPLVWKPTCDRIQGGALSNNFSEVLSTAITAAGTYFGGLGLGIW